MSCRGCPVAWLVPVIAAGVGAVLVAGGGAAHANAAAQPEKKKEPAARPGAESDDPAYVLGFKMKRIDGTEEDLSKYKGKVVVMVNVASRCGYTGQYKALEALYKEHKDHGLVILGFPANNFGSQEPGTNKEIAEFCTGTYDVTFPMFEKISVKGADQHPLYKKLTSQHAPIGGDPKWNFTKFVVDKDGKVVARFDAKGDGKSRDALEPAFVKEVEKLLGVSGGKEKKPEPKPPTRGS